MSILAQESKFQILSRLSNKNFSQEKAFEMRAQRTLLQSGRVDVYAEVYVSGAIRSRHSTCVGMKQGVDARSRRNATTEKKREVDNAMEQIFGIGNGIKSLMIMKTYEFSGF